MKILAIADAYGRVYPRVKQKPPAEAEAVMAYADESGHVYVPLAQAEATVHAMHVKEYEFMLQACGKKSTQFLEHHYLTNHSKETI